MNRSGLVALVIDDEIQIRRFLRAGFELEGFIVQEAATGADGIRAATLKPVDLVIVDLGAARHRRRRDRRAAARVVDGADHRAVGALERGGEGAPARARRRRLRGEAVRHGRAAGARARGAAAAARGSAGEPMVGQVRSPSTSPRAPCRSTARACSCRRRNTGCCRCSPSMPATSSRTSTCSRRCGA